MKNLYNDIPALKAGEEAFETLLKSETVHIERICSASVANGEWYDQPDDEWIMLLEGEATLEFDMHLRRRLQRGDTLLIPAHQRHRVVHTSASALWLAVHIHAPGDTV